VSRVLWTPPIGPWEETRPAQLAAQPGIDFLIDVSEWRDRKARALHAHQSQHLSINRIFFHRADSDAVLSTEAFRQGCGPPLATRPESNLFVGLPAARAVKRAGLSAHGGG
jgi:hypothetical protein